MDETTQVVTIVIMLIALVVTVIGAQFVRRRPNIYPLRPQSAYAMLPLMIGESIEADRPLHISIGATGIGGDSTALAVASADLLYAAAQRSARSGTDPLFTTSDASSLALGYTVLWRAYAESRSVVPRWSRARWYPAGEQSLIFAGALATISADERPTGHFLVGRFGAEIAIILESAAVVVSAPLPPVSHLTDKQRRMHSAITRSSVKKFIPLAPILKDVHHKWQASSPSTFCACWSSWVWWSPSL